MSTEERIGSSSVATLPAEEEAEHQDVLEPEAGGAAHGAGHDIHLPPESLWPIALAFAITICAFGLVTNYLVSIPGLLLFVVALRGWTQELLRAWH